ncbi:hypothetical protein BALOs_0868 [Halobacteriovorax sp. BALOs_7]|uniref:hypothetical protein n=1 Tax=Halobacteriovorax sp. BALOs_7 TaxID=2109558 RepID=UPI000EA3F983|nr:hypothetical protein [Halobacteriovorax sp. BALOs_7]AYF43878.1 hypothetical protein BALOs_0868 [Halobacteriovorax sp. BALOs_7]
MYSSSRRYRKNDWWDFMTVIDQELDRDEGPMTYYYILDELKWRMVDSVSEGETFKIKKKAQELKDRMEKSKQSWSLDSDATLIELNSLLEFLI